MCPFVMLVDKTCPRKIEEMQRKLKKNMVKQTVMWWILQNKLKTDKELQELGSTENPDTYYDTIKEAYEHKQYVGNIETALKNKQKIQPIDQIDELQKQALQEINGMKQTHCKN